RLSSNVKMTGNIHVKGKENNESHGGISYLTQEDIFLGTLTVRETITYSAHLRVSNKMRKEEIENLVEKTIEEMGLQHCADNKIGNWYFRGISGGEKKRLSIGLEILTQPQIMLLDEPTTGLDSASAFFVVCTLRNIAHNGRIVVCSIHQPSGYLFDLFDDLYLLSGGEAVYFGDAKLAVKGSRLGSEIEVRVCTKVEVRVWIQVKDQGPGLGPSLGSGPRLSSGPGPRLAPGLSLRARYRVWVGAGVRGQFFEEAGFPCPTKANPSDHFLRCVNSDFDNNIISTHQSVESTSPANMARQDIKKILIHKYDNSEYATLMRNNLQRIKSVFMMMASDIFRPICDLPKLFWQYPMTYISFASWALQGVFKNDMIGIEFDPLVAGEPKLKGEIVLQTMFKMHLNHSKWWDLAALVCLLISHRLIFLLVLKYKDTISLHSKLYFNKVIHRIGNMRRSSSSISLISQSFNVVSKKKISSSKCKTLHSLSSQLDLSSPMRPS
ncbi:hypothetical protein F8388_022436, partial [Cannabis sativa]